MRREKETQWRVVGSFLNFEQIKRGKEIRLFSVMGLCVCGYMYSSEFAETGTRSIDGTRGWCGI